MHSISLSRFGFLFVLCTVCCVMFAPRAKAEDAAPQPKVEEAAAPQPRADDDEIAQLKTAAKKGDPEAQYTLGNAYQRGDGVEQDEYTGVQWLEKAAEQGNTKAMVNLGMAYRGGFGVKQDVKIAYMWLEIATKRGNQSAIQVKKDTAEMMNQEQINEAQKLASDWKPSL